VVRVATKGAGYPGIDTGDYVTQYRLAYSEDCVTFQNLVDGAGNNVVSNYVATAAAII